jgi:hypothetical protein
MLTKPCCKGLGDFVTGPTLCLNKAFSPQDIQSSLDHLTSFIETEGPFDGIIGFSQGGSLALTYLLEEGYAAVSSSSSSSPLASPTNPSTPENRTAAESATGYSHPQPPFKFAIFLSTIVAFSPDPTLCTDILTSLTPSDRSLLHEFPHSHPQINYAALSPTPPEKATWFAALGSVLHSSLAGGFIAADTELGLEGLLSGESGAGCQDFDMDLGRVPRLMHPCVLDQQVRVRIPSVHVVGRKDDKRLVEMSRLMEGVCEEGLVRRVVHGGGHDVPRLSGDVRALWQAVDWAIRESANQLR